MTNNTLPHLAVIVVSYHVRELLRGCLRSIAASAARTADRLVVTTVVVDNASADGSADMVATEFPAVHLIASQENLGFTGANNVALRWLGFPSTEINGARVTQRERGGDQLAPESIRSASPLAPRPSPLAPRRTTGRRPSARQTTCCCSIPIRK
jgi:hypothetical protein